MILSSLHRVQKLWVVTNVMIGDLCSWLLRFGFFTAKFFSNQGVASVEDVRAYLTSVLVCKFCLSWFSSLRISVCISSFPAYWWSDPLIIRPAALNTRADLCGKALLVLDPLLVYELVNSAEVFCGNLKAIPEFLSFPCIQYNLSILNTAE